MKFTHCFIRYWQVRIHFSGREGRTRFFHKEGSFQKVKFSGGVLHWVNLSGFLYEISLYVLLSLYKFNFRRGYAKGKGLFVFYLMKHRDKHSSKGNEKSISIKVLVYKKEKSNHYKKIHRTIAYLHKLRY